jgi:alpha-L-rhamnosidase
LLGGIDFDMTGDADERITIRPQMLDGVEWVKCSYKSVLGPIRTEWQQEAGKTSIDVAVPPGATATVILLVKMAPSSPEDALPAEHGPQLTEVRRDAQVIVYRATAGLFHFREAE